MRNLVIASDEELSDLELDIIDMETDSTSEVWRVINWADYANAAGFAAHRTHTASLLTGATLRTTHTLKRALVAQFRPLSHATRSVFLF